MTDVGELVVRIKADAAQLERELAKANNLTKKSAGEMGTAFSRLKQELLSLAPALSAVAFVEFGRRAIDAAGHIVDLADRIGFAAGTLAALEIPLASSGSNLDEFAAAINRMNNVLGEAAKGNEEAVRAFDQLGLSVNKLRTMTPEQQFYEIASALGQIRNQSTQTEAGMNLFGRGFAAMLPLLKEFDGDMRAAVDANKDLDDSLERALKRVDAFGDSMAAAGIKIKKSFIEALAAVLELSDRIADFNAGPNDTASLLEGDTGFGTNLRFGQTSKASTSLGPHTEGPLEEVVKNAKGSNAGLLGRKEAESQAKKLAEARKTLDEYTVSLQRQNKVLKQTPREQAAMEAGYKTLDLAQKAGIKNASGMIEANKDLARTNYDLAESMREAARFQQELKDKLSASLTDIVFKAGSAKQAMLGFAESIARAAFEKKVAGPFADMLIGSGGGPGLLDGLFSSGFKMLGFADGGSPPVGVPSIVGERGPEIFVPKTAGTVVPNHAIGGTTVVVQQTINMSPGLPETVGAAVRAAAPQIAAQAQQAVFAELRRGGPASQIVGLRS